jgi:hypothetical protein
VRKTPHFDHEPVREAKANELYRVASANQNSTPVAVGGADLNYSAHVYVNVIRKGKVGINPECNSCVLQQAT